jgi:IS5 family transposase
MHLNPYAGCFFITCLVTLHQRLFGPGTLESIATDKGYYAYENERRLEQAGVKDIYLPRPNRTLDAPLAKTPGPIRQLLHDRRAGIEPVIGHIKQNGQMGKSRMKSDETTKSAGYCAVRGFNLRQLTRYVAGEVRQKSKKMAQIAANDARAEGKVSIK